MKVESTFTIKGRGLVICVTLTENGPQPGDCIRSNGVLYDVKGVEWYAMPRSISRPGRGDGIGILLGELSVGPVVGDEIEIVRLHQRTNPQSD